MRKLGVNYWPPDAARGNDVPVREFNIEDYGARGDGATVCTTAIQRACDFAALHRGTVLIPRGEFVSGTVFLRSGITIHLSAGSVLIASCQRNDFGEYEHLATPSHADDETTYFAYSLLYGIDIASITIMGSGVIDGGGVSRGGPKPIALKRCSGINIKGITIRDSPNYSLSLIGCIDAKVESVTIRNGFVDGITADSCRFVLIRDCHIETANDAICLKASLALGYPQVTENISVVRCVLSTSRSAFKIGSESSGDFKNILVTQCEMLSSSSVLADRPEAGIMVQAIDGGCVENIFVSRISMTHVRIPIFLRLGNRGRGLANPRPGTVRNIQIRQISAVGADVGAFISGIPGADINDVRIERFDVLLVGGISADAVVRDVPEEETAYPRPPVFGILPAYGLFCRHIHGLCVQNVRLKLEQNDGRPPIFAKNVKKTAPLDLVAVDSTGFQVFFDLPTTGFDCKK
jgi:polygalacturonase